MLFLVAGVGVAVVWLWFFAPDSLSDRARGVMIAIGIVVLVGCTWSTVRAVQEMDGARKAALVEARRREAEKERAIRRALEGEAFPGKPLVAN
jgi:hypothetical protein